MKRFAIALLMLLGPRYAFAVDTVWLSTTTATADTTKVLCPREASVARGHGVLHSICVNTPVTGLDGRFTVYSASASATNPLAIVWSGTASQGCSVYDIAFSSGLSYTSVSTANVTATFTCK